jgi:hypothetical protein
MYIYYTIDDINIRNKMSFNDSFSHQCTFSDKIWTNSSHPDDKEGTGEETDLELRRDVSPVSFLFNAVVFVLLQMLRFDIIIFVRHSFNFAYLIFLRNVSALCFVF